jgi:hypothetical protein
MMAKKQGGHEPRRRKTTKKNCSSSTPFGAGIIECTLPDGHDGPHVGPENTVTWH